MRGLPVDWVLEELKDIARFSPDWVTEALEDMLKAQPRLLWALVVSAYLSGRINLGKAAELLGKHRLELQEEFLAKGIPIRLGPRDEEEAKAEAAIWEWKR
jgi:predicted HTH domain antitoxin